MTRRAHDEAPTVMDATRALCAAADIYETRTAAINAEADAWEAKRVAAQRVYFARCEESRATTDRIAQHERDTA